MRYGDPRGQRSAESVQPQSQISAKAATTTPTFAGDCLYANGPTKKDFRNDGVVKEPAQDDGLSVRKCLMEDVAANCYEMSNMTRTTGGATCDEG